MDGGLSARYRFRGFETKEDGDRENYWRRGCSLCRRVRGDTEAAVGVNSSVRMTVCYGECSGKQNKQDAEGCEEQPPRRPHMRCRVPAEYPSIVIHASHRRVHTLPPGVEARFENA
jgi:hypothetical protein